MPEHVSIPFDEESSSYHYTRNSFEQAVLNDFENPPAQNPDHLEVMENVLPITKGTLDRRWGYSLYSTPLNLTSTSRMYEYQSDSTGNRKLLVCGLNSGDPTIQALGQTGTNIVRVYTVSSATTTNIPRLAVSRDTAYITTGVASGQVKWSDTSTADTTTKWGIATPGATTTSNTLPGTASNDATVGSVAWTSVNNIKVDDNTEASLTLLGGQTSNYLKGTNFGFSIPTTSSLLGITLTVETLVTFVPNKGVRLFAYLVKDGVVLTATEKEVTGFAAGGRKTLTVGAADTLWSAVLTPADTNAATFGVALKATSVNGGTIGIDYVKLAITYSGGITVGAAIGGGSITLVIGRKYCFAFRNSITGHISDISPLSNSTGAQTAKNIPLSGIIASTDTQVDRKLVLATSDGGDPSTLYLLSDIDNTVTTLTDDVPETDLLLRAIYLQTDAEGNEHGITDNTPPPIITLPTKHRGRLYGINGQNVYFSKSLDDVTTSTGTITSRYEEAWPAFNFFDVSSGAETPRALLSDGEILYIGTERAIHRHFGSGPADFLDPEILFNEVGVLNQEVWQTVFVEGAPIGTMWLTPDNRVIGSDFNSYKDIGIQIQKTILDTINQTVATTVARAAFYSRGGYDLYILAVPTGTNTSNDTLCVYNLRSRKWVIWKLTDSVSSMLHVVSSTGVGNLLFGANGNQKIYNIDSTVFQDRTSDTPVTFTARARTVWLNKGDPKLRKLLNEFEAISADPNLQVTIEGASTADEFNTPSTIKSLQYLTNSPFGDKKLYLAGSTTKDRFYRYTFTSIGTNSAFLNGYSIEVVPLHRL